MTELTALRARNRLYQIKASLAFLNRTDRVAADDVPSREERDRLLAPVLADLAKLAKRAPRRERKPLPTTKESPMSTSRCLVEGHPRHDGVGCVIDDPNAPPPAPPANRATAPAFPPALVPNIHACEGVYVVPNPDPVRRHRARDLARVVLDHAEGSRGAGRGPLLSLLDAERTMIAEADFLPSQPAEGQA